MTQGVGNRVGKKSIGKVMNKTKKREKTNYPGVFYREAKRIGGPGLEKIYYVVYKKNGKIFEEKAGRQYADDMTPARAAGIRSELIEGKRLSRKEIRERDLKKKKEKKWTFDKLWENYKANRENNKSLNIDDSRYEKFLKPMFKDKQPSEVYPLDIERLSKKLNGKSPQTIKHVFNLLIRIANYGVKNDLTQGLSFQVKKPQVNNLKTEDLTSEQLKNLLEKIEASEDKQAADIMKIALYTGMRRGEIFKLKHEDIDYHRGFIRINDPKGKVDQIIPLNEKAKEVLSSITKGKSPYIFPDKSGAQIKSINKRVNKIRRDAGIPDNFRALHGLRHVYASILASSGKVDMYTLQKLLTHKDPRMTQRYAHLRDDTLRKASNLAGELIIDALNTDQKDQYLEDKTRK